MQCIVWSFAVTSTYRLTQRSHRIWECFPLSFPLKLIPVSLNQNLKCQGQIAQKYQCLLNIRTDKYVLGLDYKKLSKFSLSTRKHYTKLLKLVRDFFWKMSLFQVSKILRRNLVMFTRKSDSAIHLDLAAKFQN